MPVLPPAERRRRVYGTITRIGRPFFEEFPHPTPDRRAFPSGWNRSPMGPDSPGLLQSGGSRDPPKGRQSEAVLTRANPILYQLSPAPNPQGHVVATAYKLLLTSGIPTATDGWRHACARSTDLFHAPIEVHADLLGAIGYRGSMHPSSWPPHHESGRRSGRSKHLHRAGL